MNRQIITLSNGKKVANFSSNHPFKFVDGSVLEPVSEEMCKLLEVTFKEKPLNDKGDLELSFDLSAEVLDEMQIWCLEHFDNQVDVVFCPLPMITAIRQDFGAEWLLMSPFRAIRVEDRTNRLISIEKQCV